MILNTMAPTAVKTIARGALTQLGFKLDEAVYSEDTKEAARLREDMDRIFNRFVRILH